VRRRRRLELAHERVDRAEDEGRREVDALVAMKEPLLDARLQRTQVDAVRRRLELPEVEPVRPRQEPVAVRPDAQQQIQEPGRGPAEAKRTQPAKDAIRPWLAERAAAEALRQLEEDLPVGEVVLATLDHGGRPAGDVAHAERAEEQVDV